MGEVCSSRWSAAVETRSSYLNKLEHKALASHPKLDSMGAFELNSAVDGFVDTLRNFLGNNVEGVCC